MASWELDHLGKRSGGRGGGGRGGGAVPGTLSRSLKAEPWPRRGAGPRANLTTSASAAKLDSHRKYLSARLFGGGWSTEEDELLQKRQLFKMLFFAKFQPGGSFVSEPLSRS